MKPRKLAKKSAPVQAGADAAPMYAPAPDLLRIVARAEANEATRRELARLYLEAGYLLKASVPVPRDLQAFIGRRLVKVSELLQRSGRIPQQAWRDAIAPAIKEVKIPRRDMMLAEYHADREQGHSRLEAIARGARQWGITEQSFARTLPPSGARKAGTRKRVVRRK